MSQIFDALKGMVTPELISKAASAIGIDPSKVESGIGSIVPSLLGSVLSKGNDSNLESTLTQAADQQKNILSDPTALLTGGNNAASDTGKSFLNSIVGDKLPGFITSIAGKIGISTDQVEKLLGMVSPMVAGFLGDKMKSGGLNLSGLLGSLGQEKDAIMKMIPSDLTGSLGLSNLAGNTETGFFDKVTDKASDIVDKVKEEASEVFEDVKEEVSEWGDKIKDFKDDASVKIKDFANKADDKIQDFVDDAEVKVKDFTGKATEDIKEFAGKAGDEIKETYNTVEEKVKSKNLGWVFWLLGLIVAAIIVFFGARSCSNKSQKEVVSPVVESTSSKINEVKLPDGTLLNIATNSIEDKIIIFLNSNEFRNATDEQLKDKWFTLNNVDFKHGSATELTAGSETQLRNIIAILKNYKDTRVKFGGYTDKTGDPESNMKLSQARADAVKRYFMNAGIPEATISAEGYGDKFAKAAADASEADRAKDRRISIRFVK